MKALSFMSGSLCVSDSSKERRQQRVEQALASDTSIEDELKEAQVHRQALL